MDDWDDIAEKYRNMEDITDADYKPLNIIWEDYTLKNSGQYHHLYIHSHNRFLAADVFINFRNKCIEIYKLNSLIFLSAPRLA